MDGNSTVDNYKIPGPPRCMPIWQTGTITLKFLNVVRGQCLLEEYEDNYSFFF